jgi:hypothetical protein
MADESTYGRKPVIVVELIQPRCSNRFGVSPCTATGTPKCYNCYWTCLDKPNYDTDGSITWRFSRPGDDVGWLYEETDADNIKTNAIPLLKSVSTTSSRINLGASRKGESPLGRRATATITFSNGVWDDHVGDYYLADRPARSTKVGFFSLMSARNPLFPDWQAKVYEGYEGQALSAMSVRLYDLEVISGPGTNDEWTATCRDPLDRVRGKNAKYPPTSQIDLASDITATGTDIEVTCLEAQLTATYGNTPERYAVIGDEVISYTGYTGTEPDFTLTGVKRGQINTTADAHGKNDAVQRGAYHKTQLLYQVAEYILTDHTTLPSSYVNASGQWDDEGNAFLSTLRCNTFIGEPTPVEDLLGELCRDGLFSIWWDERAQVIPLLAVRPPQETPAVWDEGDHVISFGKKVIMDDRMTRVTNFFGPRNFLNDLDQDTNYENRRIRIDAEVELDAAAGGKVFENTIYSRWTQTFSNALLVGASLLLRYRLPPQYLTLTVDAKDRDTDIGDVIDLTTRDVLDTEGNPLETRWQVIAVEEVESGHKLKLELQSYAFVGKFAIIMENSAPDYATATDAEKLSGCWIAENTGLMPDGSEPYLLQ